MRNCQKRNPRKLNETKKLQFAEVIPFNDNLKLSLNSLVDMFPHTTQLLDILGVHSFHVESVVLMSKVAPNK